MSERETTLNFIASRLAPDTVRKRLPIWGFVAGSVILFLFAGCGTLKNGRSWGEDAFYPVDFKKISHAAFNAFFDLQTLIPAAGALIFAVDDFDDEVSDWATDHNPIFGSDQNAKDASDVLRNVLLAEFFVTALATPSGNDARKWTYAKTKGLGVELAALGTTLGATGLLKATTARDRPDESDNNSFPSGHSSASFSAATLANRNIDSIRVQKKLKRPLQVGNLILATSVAWARVEGRKHFPSDVLAGAALGHFLTAFRKEMAVHGRYRKPCPDCSTPVQRIRYASNETNYCPQCQTGGKLLADRALSRLLKKDWPRTVEELEAIKRRD